MNNICNMVNLMDLVAYCDDRTQLHEVKDFPGAFNGLQIENNGKVSKRVPQLTQACSLSRRQPTAMSIF